MCGPKYFQNHKNTEKRVITKYPPPNVQALYIRIYNKQIDAPKEKSNNNNSNYIVFIN